jgi:hypothetical protein
MLSSLVAQTDDDWNANIVIDGNDYSDIILNAIHLFNDSRIKYNITNERYNDWGHTPREFGKQISTADYIVMTGDDNYYTPNFVKEIRLACQENAGLIYWDMVHSHYDYSYFICSPFYNQIDIGSFATRRDLAQQIKLGKEYAADGLFIENFKHHFPNETLIKIKKVLYVHN